jgi:hypothetical protein
MPRAQRIIQSFTSYLLILLVLLLSGLAVHQDALAVPAKKVRALVAQTHHGPSFRKVALHKESRRHPAAPTKHRRVRAHRPVVVKIAMPEACLLEPVITAYHELAPLPLTSVYRYVYFLEITPPPPKDC